MVMTSKEELVLRRTTYQSGCWVFTGYLDSYGYGRVCRKAGGTGLAHRAVYIALIGDPGDGLVLDHLCRNPACVNPWHMQPTSVADNVARGASKGAAPVCKMGHAYTIDNTATVRIGRPLRNGEPRFKRVCRVCRRGWRAAYKAKAKVLSRS